MDGGRTNRRPMRLVLQVPLVFNLKQSKMLYYKKYFCKYTVCNKKSCSAKSLIFCEIINLTIVFLYKQTFIIQLTCSRKSKKYVNGSCF